MRIIAVKAQPVAVILTILYATSGFVVWLWYAFTGAPSLKLPLGFLAPMLQLSLYLDVAKSSSILWNLLLCIASVISYAVTGWISGSIMAFLFNLVAKWMGGIDARYIEVSDDH